MFHTQPMYTDVEVWHEGHEEEAGNQCIIAGVIYIVTLVVSGSPLLRGGTRGGWEES